jgi:hypothetical protein
MQLVNLQPSISCFQQCFHYFLLNNLYQNLLEISVNKEKKYTYSCKINDQYPATAAKGRGY